MPKWLLAVLAATALHAAEIRGTVVEHATGKPLPRALVLAHPIAGGTPVSARTTKSGAFELSALPPGTYLLSASRRSFAPVQYGQKRWRGSGAPVVLGDQPIPAIRIRMQRFGSISGVVLDENDVGLPEHGIGAFRATRPPRLVGKGRTDDRGVYQISGLEPGSYLVRTLGADYGDGGYLPTWSAQTMRVDQALPVEVQLDQQVPGVNIRPFPGQLFSVAGYAVSFPQRPITLTLSSDAGIETAVSERDGAFKFRPVPPGAYELTATAEPDRRANTGPQAGWMPIVVDRDRDWRINLGPLPTLQVTVVDTKGNPLDPHSVSILAVRKELSGETRSETLDPVRQPLLPGRWDVALFPSPSWYVADFLNTRTGRSSARPDGWNEVVLSGADAVPVKFTLSANPGSIRGVVTNADQPAAGAPVFLDPYDGELRERVPMRERVPTRSTRTDSRGEYHFSGLPPGAWRVLSTFDFQMPDLAMIDAARPLTIKVEEGREAVVPLTLYAIP